MSLSSRDWLLALLDKMPEVFAAHKTQRRTGWKDPKRRSEYYRAWFSRAKTNPEWAAHRREVVRAYKASHPETKIRAREYQREYRKRIGER